MKKALNFEHFDQVFAARIKVSSAISDTQKITKTALQEMKAACEELEIILNGLDPDDIVSEHLEYCGAASIFHRIAEWKYAIENAEMDSSRFLSAAKLKAAEMLNKTSRPLTKKADAFLLMVGETQTPGDIGKVRSLIINWSLPLLVYTSTAYKDFWSSRENTIQKSEPKFETAVAFIKFDIDGEPAREWNYLTPGVSYDLSIEVRVSNWPLQAEKIVLIPITMDALERNWLPRFEFNKPHGPGPYILTSTRRAQLNIPHSFGSRPYEFLYAVEFDSTLSDATIAVVGHRRLLLEGVDSKLNPISGFQNIDKKLIEIRNELRSMPGVGIDEIANALLLLGVISNLAAQSTRDGIFSKITSESEFQNKTAELLRFRSEIGEKLQSHPGASGGITDLVFNRIPIELKLEKSKSISVEQCDVYFPQVSSYAIALGSRIGILFVLDASAKHSPIGSIEDDIKLFSQNSAVPNIAIITIIARSGFPKPSKIAKKKRPQKQNRLS